MCVGEHAVHTGGPNGTHTQPLAQGAPADPEALAQHVATFPGASAGVLLDCTASDSLPQHYTHWLGTLGLHIITPNKHLGSGPLQRYQQLRQLQHNTGWRVEGVDGGCSEVAGRSCDGVGDGFDSDLSAGVAAFHSAAPAVGGGGCRRMGGGKTYS